MWQYHIVKLISRIVCLLPLPVKRFIGNCLGYIFWLVTPAWRKRLAADQVRQCLQLSEEKAWEIAKKSVLKYGPMIAEVLDFPNLNKENIAGRVSFMDRSKFDVLFDEGKGIIVATAHFGNWEMLGAAFAFYGYPLVAVAKQQKNAAMDRFINEYRTMVGEHVTYKQGVLEMARMLSEGFGIGLLADQDGGGDGVVVDFFGRETSCPKGPAALSRLKNAPMVLVLLYSKGNNQHEIYVSDRIKVKRTKNREQDIKDATQQLMHMLEDAIRREPEAWFWLHNRWKADKKKYK